MFDCEICNECHNGCKCVVLWSVRVHRLQHSVFLLGLPLPFLSWKHRRVFTGPKLNLSSGFSPEAFPINGYAARQRRFDNEVSLSIHKTVELFNHASRDLGSSKTFWFCLEPRSIQLPSTTTRRFPYLGHIGLTV